MHKRGIDYYVISEPKVKLPIISKLWSYYNFKKRCFSITRRLMPDKQGLLWIEGANTILALGRRIKDYNYVLQIQELHEKYKYQLNAIGNVINEAKIVFMPEYNRTCIYQCWFHLEKRPIVLPNKPYFTPNEYQLSELSKKYYEQLKVFREKKVILYQGHIHPERDLTNFVKAVNKMGDDYRLVLLGHDHGILNNYLRISRDIIHINFVPAPDYLVFTKACYIGIVCYDPMQLNTTYCAPNKIYEYGAFSKPMLGNDIPGLKVIESHNAGILVEDNVDSILAGLKKLESSYKEYSLGAKDLYESVDTKAIIKDSFEK